MESCSLEGCGSEPSTKRNFRNDYFHQKNKTSNLLHSLFDNYILFLLLLNKLELSLIVLIVNLIILLNQIIY